MTRSLLPSLTLVAALVAGCGQKPASVEIQPPNFDLGRKSETKSLTATVKDGKGEVIAEAPIEWSSSAPKVASVDGSGKVTALSTGTAVITAKAGEESDQAMANVLIPAKIEIEPPRAVLRGAGLTQELIARVIDDKGQSAPDARLEWSSGNPAVATVQAGTVSSLADGEATITVKSGDVSATAAILVKGPQPTTIVMDPPIVVLKAGSTQPVNALISDDAGQPMQNVPVTWATADPAIATASSTGLVTGIRRGDTTLTATAGAAVGQARVSIK